MGLKRACAKSAFHLRSSVSTSMLFLLPHTAHFYLPVIPRSLPPRPAPPRPACLPPGRHLFLQEKFSKLRQPAAPAARMRLPPRLTAAAVEAFLCCEQLAGAGTAWLVEQVSSMG